MCERHVAHILRNERGRKDAGRVLDELWPNPPRCRWKPVPKAILSPAGAPRAVFGNVRYYSVDRTVWQMHTAPRGVNPTTTDHFMVLQFILCGNDMQPLAAWLASVQAASADAACSPVNWTFIQKQHPRCIVHIQVARDTIPVDRFTRGTLQRDMVPCIRTEVSGCESVL
jgi:hypothetical protein